MDIVMIGFGCMGVNMVQCLYYGGYCVVGYDLGEGVCQCVVEVGLEVVDLLVVVVVVLLVLCVVWLMVLVGEIVDQMLGQLILYLVEGDIVIDGGNFNYQDLICCVKVLVEDDLGYVDCGISGGVWGLQEGYSLMVGGEVLVVEQIVLLLCMLVLVEDCGWVCVGLFGVGYFIKMVYNGIEYGMMQVYVEGFVLMECKQEMVLDLVQVVEVWCYGSVVCLWLLDLSIEVFKCNLLLDGIVLYVEDFGEGCWIVVEVIVLDVLVLVIMLLLLECLCLCELNLFIDCLLLVMCNEFGGYVIWKL